MENDKAKPKAPVWMFAATAGSSFVAPVIVGVLLDIEFGWTPWATFVGLTVGIISCLGTLLISAKKSTS